MLFANFATCIILAAVFRVHDNLRRQKKKTELPTKERAAKETDARLASRRDRVSNLHDLQQSLRSLQV